MLSTLQERVQERGFGGFSGSLATIVEEVTEQCGGSFFEEAAFDEGGVVKSGIGEDVVERARVSGFGIRGRVDQAREAACVGGAGAHGAWFQGSVEGAACQSPAARGGGCTTDRQELGVGGGIPCSFALVGGDSKNLPAPGDDGPDGNLTLLGGTLSGEQGAAHHGEVGLRTIVYQWLRHEADDSSLYFDVVAPEGARLGSHPCLRQFALDTGSDLIPHGPKRPQVLSCS
jgi:hypothetical protein